MRRKGLAISRAKRKNRGLSPVFAETAFISNPEEEARLNDEAYQEQMAEAILEGIRQYFAKNPPLAKSKLASLAD